MGFAAMSRSSSLLLLCRDDGSVAVSPSEHVHDNMLHGSTFGEDRWDFEEIRRPAYPTRYLSFERIPISYRLDVKLYLLFQGRPHHPYAVETGVVLRRKPASLNSLYATLSRFSLLSPWGEQKGLTSFSAWTPDDAEDFLDDLRSGSHREKGRSNDPTTVRAYVALMKNLAAMAPAAPNPLLFVPWPTQSAAEVAGEVKDLEGRTPPLPFETWKPLISAASFILTECSSQILAAHAAFRTAPKADELKVATRGRDSAEVLEDYLDAGGRIPLHTGFGRAAFVPRGQPNLSNLQRRSGISANLFRPTHAHYDPAIVKRVEAAIEDGLVEYGGLVPCPPGSPIGEIALSEAEYLGSVLRGASYILIASFSAMRDSELQAIERGAVSPHPEVPTIRSMTFKHQGVRGRTREWWVPTVVEKAADALERLTGTKRLFARSGRTGEGGDSGKYNPYRDIDRLIKFTNASPEERPGRGVLFPLESIAVPHGQAINARSLRRSFCVYAAAYPGLDVGIGMQLGHASLRATGGYVHDRRHAATAALDDERAKAVREDLARLIYSSESIGGPAADRLLTLRAQVVADPSRAEQLIARTARHYYLGLTNDCAYSEESAACGPGGPKLADHFCAGGACPNAVMHIKHVPVQIDQLARYDKALNVDNLDPGLERNLRRGRENVVKRIAEIAGSSEEKESE